MNFWRNSCKKINGIEVRKRKTEAMTERKVYTEMVLEEKRRPKTKTGLTIPWEIIFLMSLLKLKYRKSERRCEEANGKRKFGYTCSYPYRLL